MNRWTVAACVAGSLAGGALLSARSQLPSEPGGKFGRSITGAYEGWYDNKDGSHVFLVGYYNRNLAQEVDIPIGPNNRIEPGGPDFGQPTHFLPGRQVGMFTVTVPKEFTQQQRLTWTIVDNGMTTSIPLRLHHGLQHQPVRGRGSPQHAASAEVRGERRCRPGPDRGGRAKRCRARQRSTRHCRCRSG